MRFYFVVSIPQAGFSSLRRRYSQAKAWAITMFQSLKRGSPLCDVAAARAGEVVDIFVFQSLKRGSPLCDTPST